MKSKIKNGSKEKHMSKLRHVFFYYNIEDCS